MRLFVYFVRCYPFPSAVMLACLVIAAMAEAIGIATLLPLLSVVTAGADPSGAEPSHLERLAQAALDRVGVEPELSSLLLIFTAAMVMQSGLVLLARRQVGYTVAHVTTDLRFSLLRALSAARWSYFTTQPAGAIANSISTETNRAGAAYLSGASIVSLSLQAVLYAAIALTISWPVTVAAPLAGVLVMYTASHFVTLSRRAGSRRTRLMRSLMRRLTDGLQVMKPLKAMSRESLMGPLLENDARRLNRALERQVLAGEALPAVQRPLIVALVCSGIYFAMTYWEMSLAELAVLTLLFMNTLKKLTKAQREYQYMAVNESALWAFHETIERAKAYREVTEGRRVPGLRRGIRFEAVGFQYDEQPVLADVSLEIPAGQITAIVGPSGAGKTSLADLVCGLVQPATGTIFVDGVPLEDLDLRAWRRMIGYVPQEMVFLNESVRLNVTLGDDLSDAQVEMALQQAGAWDFVSQLPDGLDALVGEHGSRLSGGQRQRISIARALVHGANLLILDEATTALDPESEARVLESLTRLRGEKTILAISHQAGIIAVADRIYRVEGGKVFAVDAEGAARAKVWAPGEQRGLPEVS